MRKRTFFIPLSSDCLSLCSRSILRCRFFMHCSLYLKTACCNYICISDRCFLFLQKCIVITPCETIRHVWKGLAYFFTDLFGWRRGRKVYLFGFGQLNIFLSCLLIPNIFPTSLFCIQRLTVNYVIWCELRRMFLDVFPPDTLFSTPSFTQNSI